MSIVLREITKDDAQTLALLEKECFADAWSQGMLLGGIGRLDFCGALLEEDGNAVGYVFGQSLFEDGEIARIAVLPKKRGKGYGGKLLDAFLKACQSRGAKRVFLEVRVSNISAVQLYESRGFTKTRLRCKYYADGEDAQEMIKEL